MLSYLKSENLKYKRTFSRKILIIGPIFIIGFAFFIVLLAGLKNQELLALVFNWWPLFFMPLGTDILSAMDISKEKKSGSYRGILSRPLSLVKFWISIIRGGLLISYHSISLIITASLYIWIISLCFIPLYLFLASVGGAGASILVAFGGLFSGVIMASESKIGTLKIHGVGLCAV